MFLQLLSLMEKQMLRPTVTMVSVTMVITIGSDVQIELKKFVLLKG